MEPLYTFLCAGCRSWSTVIQKSALGRSAPVDCPSCAGSDFRCRVESRAPTPSSTVAAVRDGPARVIVFETPPPPPPPAARKFDLDAEARVADDERKSKDDGAGRHDSTARARKRRRDRRHRSASPSDAERLLASLSADADASVVELPHPSARRFAACSGAYEIESLGGSLVPVVADGVSTLACDIQPVRSAAASAPPDDTGGGTEPADTDADTRASLIPSHSMPTLEALSPWDRVVRTIAKTHHSPSLPSAATSRPCVWPHDAETQTPPPRPPLPDSVAPTTPTAPKLTTARLDDVSRRRDSSGGGGEADIFTDSLARLPSQFAWTLAVLTSC